MGYGMPIVCKELYIPVKDYDGITLDEFKAQTGIDLSQYIKLTLEVGNGLIEVKFPINVKVYLIDDSQEGSEMVYLSRVSQPNAYDSTLYNAGEQDGECYFQFMDVGASSSYGLRLVIDKDSEFTKENIRIYKQSI